MDCEKCGKEISPGNSFCQSCGAPVGQQPPPEVAPGAPTLIPPPPAPRGNAQAGQPPSPVPPPPQAAATPTGGPARSSGWAIASLVMGILGWTCLFFVGGVLAIIFGAVAKHEIHKSNGKLKGGGMATAGIVLGSVIVLIVLIGAAIFFPLSLIDVGPTRTITRTVSQQGAGSVIANLDMRNGNLVVGGGAPELMRGVFTYNVSKWKPSITYAVTGGTGRLSVKQPGEWHWNFWNTRNDWDLHFKNGVPLVLKATLHAGDSTLNLADLDLQELIVDANAGNVNADLSGNMPTLHNVLANLNAGNLNVDMGGTYSSPMAMHVSNDFGNVDVSLLGTWKASLEGSIEDSAGNVTVKVPGNVGVIVTATSSVGDIQTSGMRKGPGGGDTFVNAAYGSTKVTLKLNVRASAGNIRLMVSQ